MTPRSGGAETLLHEKPRSGCWALAGGSLFFSDRDPHNSNSILRFDLDTKSERAVAVLGKPLFCPVPSLSVSEDSQRIVWAQIDRSEVDLFLTGSTP